MANIVHVNVLPEAKAWLDDLADELHKFYRKIGRKLKDTDLAIEIERRFGPQLLEKVCIPHGLYDGACLLIAMEVAKEGRKHV